MPRRGLYSVEELKFSSPRAQTYRATEKPTWNQHLPRGHRPVTILDDGSSKCPACDVIRRKKPTVSEILHGSKASACLRHSGHDVSVAFPANPSETSKTEPTRSSLDSEGEKASCSVNQSAKASQPAKADADFLSSGLDNDGVFCDSGVSMHSFHASSRFSRAASLENRSFESFAQRTDLDRADVSDSVQAAISCPDAERGVWFGDSSTNLHGVSAAAATRLCGGGDQDVPAVVVLQGDVKPVSCVFSQWGNSKATGNQPACISQADGVLPFAPYRYARCVLSRVPARIAAGAVQSKNVANRSQLLAKPGFAAPRLSGIKEERENAEDYVVRCHAGVSRTTQAESNPRQPNVSENNRNGSDNPKMPEMEQRSRFDRRRSSATNATLSVKTKNDAGCAVKIPTERDGLQADEDGGAVPDQNINNAVSCVNCPDSRLTRMGSIRRSLCRVSSKLLRSFTRPSNSPLPGCQHKTISTDTGAKTLSKTNGRKDEESQSVQRHKQEPFKLLSTLLSSPSTSSLTASSTLSKTCCNAGPVYGNSEKKQLASIAKAPSSKKRRKSRLHGRGRHTHQPLPQASQSGANLRPRKNDNEPDRAKLPPRKKRNTNGKQVVGSKVQKESSGRTKCSDKEGMGPGKRAARPVKPVCAVQATAVKDCGSNVKSSLNVAVQTASPDRDRNRQKNIDVDIVNKDLRGAREGIRREEVMAISEAVTHNTPETRGEKAISQNLPKDVSRNFPKDFSRNHPREYGTSYVVRSLPTHERTELSLGKACSEPAETSKLLLSSDEYLERRRSTLRTQSQSRLRRSFCPRLMNANVLFCSSSDLVGLHQFYHGKTHTMCDVRCNLATRASFKAQSKVLLFSIGGGLLSDGYCVW